MTMGNCNCSPGQVDLMFKRAEQYIEDRIADFTKEARRYWVDMFPVKAFPDGVGLTLDKLRFFGDPGPIFDGYDGWRKVQITRRAAEAALMGEHDGCGYVWEEVGHGMETVSFDLMQRDLRTKPICIKDIRTFFQYQEVQNLIFKNLANISMNMREQLNRNAALSFAIKYAALAGLPVNTADPHQLPVVPAGITLGKLTYGLLLQVYHMLCEEAAAYALTNLNGMPAFGLIAHPETLHEMSYSSADMRADLREYRASDLISKYNFLNAVGPFVLMPDLHAPRYNRDANGVMTRVFPFDRSIPIEIGTRPVVNPAYYTAEFELVLIMTKDPFNLRTRRALTSVGGETNFDAETGLFEWKWHNPERCEDPYRRVGRYVTTGEIGVEPGDFTDYAAVLIARKPSYAGIEYWEAEVCPPERSSCDNELPLQGCPCPQVIEIHAAVEGDELIVVFDRSIDASIGDEVELETPNGSYTTGTVEEISADGSRVRFSFDDDVVPVPGMFVGVRCLDVEWCSATVLKAELCGILNNTVTLVLNRLIRADNGETITLNLCNGDTQDVQISAVSEGDLRYTVGMTWQEYCEAGGVLSVCVPPETDASCPECGGGGLVPCAYDICGNVEDDSQEPVPLENVVLTLTVDGEVVDSTTTAATGAYCFHNIQAGTEYTITPTLADYTFAPATITGTLSGDVSDADFVGSAVIP